MKMHLTMGVEDGQANWKDTLPRNRDSFEGIYKANQVAVHALLACSEPLTPLCAGCGPRGGR